MIGLRTKTLDGFTQIDGTFIPFRLVESLTLTVDEAYGGFTYVLDSAKSPDFPPIIAVSNSSSNVYVGASGFLNSNSEYQTEIAVGLSNANDRSGSITIYAFAFGTGGGDFGVKVRNEAGTVVFNSNDYYLNFVVTDIASQGAAETIEDRTDRVYAICTQNSGYGIDNHLGIPSPHLWSIQNNQIFKATNDWMTTGSPGKCAVVDVTNFPTDYYEE